MFRFFLYSRLNNPNAMKMPTRISKRLCYLASLNHNNIYIAADPTHVNVDHAEHVGGPTMFTQQITTTHVLMSTSCEMRERFMLSFILRLVA